MGKSKSSKKRRSRQNNHAAKSVPTAKDKDMKTPPPLPSIDVPIFNLEAAPKHGDADHSGSEDLQLQQPARKKLKKEKEHPRDVPEFCVSPTKLKRMVRVSDLQELVLWLLADGVASQWLLVKRKQDIKKAVVIMVPGLDMALLDGSVNLVGKQPPVALSSQDEDEDMGEVVERTEDGGPTAEELDNKEAIGRPVTEDAEDGEIMEDDKPSEEGEGTWTTVGNRRNPGAKSFSFFPSLLSGRPLAPCLTPLREIFSHVWPTKTDGDDKTNKIHSPIVNFLNSPLDKTTTPAAYKNINASPNINITKLLMTPEGLLENEYPMHSSVMRKIRQAQGYNEDTPEDIGEREKRIAGGWVETKVTGLEKDDNNETRSKTEGRKVYAVDCEMCNTEAGPELTRISVVGWDGKVVYDTLVKPTRPIIDYLTQFSGITKAKLESVTTTLADVQSHLLQLFTPPHKVILVGQSLNSDLNALKFTHPYIVDTACIYEHIRGKPFKPSLKWLAYKYLKREIQKGQHVDPLTKKMEPGHDSVEDAIACLDLVNLKLEKGLAFGNNEVRTESIFTRLERGGASGGNRHKLCWGAVVDHGNPAMLYGHAARKTVACQTDQDVVAGVKAVLGWRPEPIANTPDNQKMDPRARLAGDGEISFVWARLRELEVLRGWDRNSSRPQQESLPSLSSIPRDPAPSILAAKVSETVVRLKEIYDTLPVNTAFIVYSGTGDPREMSHLNALMKRFKEEYRTKKWDELSVKWTDDEQQALNRAVKSTREGGLSFLTVKT